MNRLEKWCEDDVIELFMPEDAQWEATQSRNPQITSKALSYIALEGLAHTLQERRMLKQIEAIVFPRDAKNQNDHKDVNIIFTALKYFGYLITDDGDSNSQPGGILGHATELHDQLGVIVMRDHEAVALVEQWILERDAKARQIASTIGESLPSWVGVDMMTIEETNTTLVRHIIEDYWHSRQGLEALTAYIAPGYVHHAAIGDYDFEGFRGGLGSFIDACPDVRHVITHLIAEGDLVAAHVRMTGTQTGAFGAIAPTGKVLTLTGAYHCHIVDGKLVEDWDSWTALPLFQQTAAVLQG